MTKNMKNKLNTYLSGHLKDLENMPVNEDTLYIVDSITSIDRSIYRKDWFAVYKKCRRVIDHVEDHAEINDESNHYFLHCSSLLDSLYLSAYGALSKVYHDMISINEEEWMSMDEFLSTVREKFGERLEEVAPAPSRESAYRRLMSMTSPKEESAHPIEVEKLIVRLNEVQSNLESVLALLRFDEYSKDIKEPLMEEITSILVTTQGMLNESKAIVHSDTFS